MKAKKERKRSRHKKCIMSDALRFRRELDVNI